MKIPTNEKLCEMSQEELLYIRKKAQEERVIWAKYNNFKRHQDIGDLLCKLDQLIEA